MASHQLPRFVRGESETGKGPVGERRQWESQTPGQQRPGWIASGAWIAPLEVFPAERAHTARVHPGREQARGDDGFRRAVSVAHPRGFTLIEVLVVTFILAIMIGLVALRLGRDDRDLVRDEADRLVVLLQAAREEAILQGSLLALEMGSEGYRFLRPDDKGKLVPIADAPLTPRRFPERMEARLELEGQQGPRSQAIVLDPSGALPAFRIAFILNGTHWWVLGQQDGKIRSTPTADAHAI